MAVTVSGQTLNAVIDGRAIQPLPTSAFANPAHPPTLVFADGKPAPTVSIDPSIAEQLAAISAERTAAAAACSAFSAAAGAVDPPIEPPHTGTAPFSQPCIDCRGHCEGTEHDCGGGAFAAYGGAVAGAAFAGPEAAVAAFLIGGAIFGAAVDACQNAYFSCTAACSNPGNQCCPIANGSSCCIQSDVAIPGTSLCCNANHLGCVGPLGTTCYDPTQDFCLPSGEACPDNTTTCGTGVNAVCCPGGTCSGNQCVLPGSFGIVSSAMKDQTGLAVTTIGSGFTPQAHITITYTGIPKDPNARVAQTVGLTADAQGNFAFTDPVDQPFVFGGCTQAQAFQEVTITAKDGSPPIGTGNSTTTTLTAAFWCGQ
jgi:hypothetical protein